MKKILFLLIFISLIISCDFSLLQQEGDPFETTEMPSSVATDEPIKFLMLSDLHLGRSEEDNGVTDYSKQTLDFIDGKQFAFTLLGGDIAVTGHQYGKVAKYITDLKIALGNDNIIYTIGNHEIHYTSKQQWLDYNFGITQHLYHQYILKDASVSIYNLNTGKRSLGLGQLNALENALKQDKNEVKIFLGHVPISGSPLEASTLQFTLATAEERNKLISLMKKYGVGIYIAGHHHIGNWEEHYDNTTGEFIMSAAHARDFFNLESTGYIYEGTIDKTEKLLTIQAYHLPTFEKAKTYYFNLP